MPARPTIWTIGHSTRPIAEFIDLLRAHGVQRLVDVRHYPGSRRFPHFNQEPLRESLEAAGLAYAHERDLGGRRRARRDSANTAWRNESFRGYADHMETDAFKAALQRLKTMAQERPSAIMCAEAYWGSCHRGLISDALKADGWRVLHIRDDGPAEEHPYTRAARIVDGRLSYAGDPGLFKDTGKEAGSNGP